MHDPKYDEKPDHSHYAACAARSNEIYEFSRNVFVYTAGVCLVMLFITYCGAAMPLVSWIPSLLGCPTCVPFLFSQTAELIVVAFLSFLAFHCHAANIAAVLQFLIIHGISSFNGGTGERRVLSVSIIARRRRKEKQFF